MREIRRREVIKELQTLSDNDLKLPVVSGPPENSDGNILYCV